MKSARVRKSRRKSRKNKIVLRKGALPRYRLTNSAVSRRKALHSAVKRDGYVTVMRRVNIISVFLRNRSPALSKKAESDKKWLMREYR